MNTITARHVIARLTLGPISQDDEEYWAELLRTETIVEKHFHETGLALHIALEWGLAWLTQQEPAADSQQSSPVPRVLRADKLPYHASLLLALLREKYAEHLSQFETLDDLVFSHAEITTILSPYLPATTDESKLESQSKRAANKLEGIGILTRDRNRDGDGWLVRPLIQAKLTTQVAAELRERIVAYGNDTGAKPASEAGDGNPTE